MAPTVTGGYVIKKRGSAPIMIVNPMEIEEAAKSGLKVYSYNDFQWGELVKSVEGDLKKATPIFWQRILEGQQRQRRQNRRLRRGQHRALPRTDRAGAGR